MRRTHAAAALVFLPALVATVALTGPAASARSGLVHAPLAASAAKESSTNWAGYSVMSLDPANPTTFTSVTGTWTQAAAACSTGHGSAASAVWVGLGGYSTSSQALEQIGTDADCSGSGRASYYAWYELVPEPPVNLRFPINPGDTITTSVNVSGNAVLLQIKDRTRGTVFTKRATTSAIDLTSAEWIAEAPSSCSRSSDCTPLPLANFGSVGFSHIATIGNSHPGTLTDPSWTAVPIQLVPRAGGGFYPGQNRRYVTQNSTAGTSAPAGLTADGRAFTLSWVSNANSG
jgi:peptidase A4-like protein